jgi:hypothetical protein
MQSKKDVLNEKQRKLVNEKLEAVAEIQAARAKLAKINQTLFENGIVHTIDLESGNQVIDAMAACW